MSSDNQRQNSARTRKSAEDQVSRDTNLPKPPAEDASLIDWARWHYQNGQRCGYRVTAAKPGEKAAYLSGWSKNQFETLEAVEVHWKKNPHDNTALVPAEGYFWFDADDLALLKAAVAKHGPLPVTYTQRSINGNLHYLLIGDVTGNPTLYFEVNGVGRKLGDVRGAGAGQCVGAGSRGHNKQGNPGHWSIETLAAPADAPDWLLAMIKAGKSSKAPRKTGEAGKSGPRQMDPNHGVPAPLVLVDAHWLVRDFTRWLAGEPVETMATPKGAAAAPCKAGEGGNNMLAATGAMAHDWGLSEDVALQLALEHHNPRCEPPWSNTDYARHFRSGYRSATGNLGRAAHIDTSKLFKPVPMEERGPKPGDPLPPDAASLGIYYDDGLDDIPDPVWLIDGVIPEGSVTLYGKRGSMKSFAALDMALCIANGVAYHGKRVTRGRVVYFAGEGFKGNKRRIQAWYKEHKLTPSRHFALIRTAIKWDTDKGGEKARQILAEVAKGGPISVVIIDTVRKGMSGDENAPTAVGEFIDGVSNVCVAFDCGYLLVHHAGKDDSKGARGGGPFEDDVDGVFKFTRDPKTGLVSVTCTKMKDAEDGQKYVFRPEKVTLGQEADGKPITSLVLKLESESQGGEDEEGAEPGVPDRRLHALQDATAMHILRVQAGLTTKRGELAVAIMAELAPEMREDDPDASTRPSINAATISGVQAKEAHSGSTSPARTLGASR